MRTAALVSVQNLRKALLCPLHDWLTAQLLCEGISYVKLKKHFLVQMETLKQEWRKQWLELTCAEILLLDVRAFLQLCFQCQLSEIIAHILQGCGWKHLKVSAEICFILTSAGEGYVTFSSDLEIKRNCFSFGRSQVLIQAFKLCTTHTHRCLFWKLRWNDTGNSWWLV